MTFDDQRLTDTEKPALLTLYGKALDARSSDPILGDTMAYEAVRAMDFDFKSLKLPSGAAISLPVRAKHLDGWTREFLAAHPRSTVLHLGCGLDTRVYRVDPPAGARWYDVDLPAVIELPDLVSRLGRSAFSRAYFRAVAAGFKRNSMLHLRYQFS